MLLLHFLSEEKTYFVIERLLACREFYFPVTLEVKKEMREGMKRGRREEERVKREERG
jgi:hypothetical protein